MPNLERSKYLAIIRWVRRQVLNLRQVGAQQRLFADQRRGDYMAACLRRDTRRQRETLEAYIGAKNAQLAAEINWKGGW